MKQAAGCSRTMDEYWRSKYDELARKDIPDWRKSNWWDRKTYLRQRKYALRSVGRISRGRKLRILDIGCGPGDLSRELSGRGHEVVAVDYSLQALICARENRSAGAPLYCMADGKALPLRGGFDLVLALGVLSTEGRWRTLLAEAFSVLAPGGHAIMTFHRQHEPWELVFWPFYLLQYCGYFPENHAVSESPELVRRRHALFCANGLEPPHAIMRFRASELEREIGRNGGRIIDRKYCGWIKRFPCLLNSFFMFMIVRKHAGTILFRQS